MAFSLQEEVFLEAFQGRRHADDARFEAQRGARTGLRAAGDARLQAAAGADPLRP